MSLDSSFTLNQIELTCSFMGVFLLTLLTSALWALSNCFDKYLVSRYFKDATVGAMVVFSALIALAVLPIALFLQDRAFDIGVVVPVALIFNGCLYLIAVQLYLIALRTSDVSTAVPIFQLIPVISLILAYLVLGEVLSTNQLIGGGLITLGAVAISIESKAGHRPSWRADVLGLISLSSFVFALQVLIFKAFAIHLRFWNVMVWESVGFIAFGLLLLIFVKTYRRDFIRVFGQGGLAPSLHMTGELIYITGKVCFNYVSLLTPITLAWLGVGFQPVFIMIYTIVLATFFPRILKEDVLGRSLLRKGLAICVMLIGSYILA